MSTEVKLRFLVGFLAICVIALFVQGYFLWRMDQKVSEVAIAEDIPASIQRRLEEQLADDPASYSAFPGTALSSGFTRDPFVRMQQMQRQMDSLFNSFTSFGGFGSFTPPAFGSGSGFVSMSPNLELIETDEDYQVRIQSPPDQDIVVNTELEANLLTVTGTVSQTIQDSSNGFASSFVSNSQFSRSFDLDERVDEFGVITEQTEGGLLVRVPKV